MSERLYSEYPALYDAIQSEWDYDRDVAFVLDVLDSHGVEGDRLLEVGAGTGEHTRRFVEEGFDVVAVEPSHAMRAAATEKCDAEFRPGELPDLDVEGEFDAVVALRGVVNHLPPDALAPSLQALSDPLADEGVLVFDNSPLPADGNSAGLDVGTTAAGDYARVVQMTPRDDGRLSWDALVFPPEGRWFVDTKPMTPFEDLTLAAALSELGLAVEPHDGFGTGDRRTVFVAVTT